MFADMRFLDAFSPLTQWQEAVDALPEELRPQGLTSDIKAAFPWAAGLLVLAYSYAPFEAYPAGCLEIPSYYFASHACYLAKQKLIDHLKEQNIKAEDAKNLPHKAIAQRCGAGGYGANGLFYWHGLGSRVCLAVIAVDQEVAAGASPRPTGQCTHCGACRAACPAGALPGDGTVGASCLRRTRKFGCDDCQLCCPANPPVTTAPPPEYENLFNINAILGDSAEQLKQRCRAAAGLIGKNYAKPSILLDAARGK